MSATEANNRPQEPVPARVSSGPARRGKPTGARKWLFRLAAMTLIPTLAFGILEASLRLANYGCSTDFFVDGTRIEGRDVWIDNWDFDRWAFPLALLGVKPVPVALEKRKPAGTYRIFVLGESAAQGYPDYKTSFARILEVMLRDRYRNVRIEIVNTSMVAINSHIVRAIARQCAQLEPDLLIVHLGNNEVVGPFGAAGVVGPFAFRLDVIRANLGFKTTRTGQFLNRQLQDLTQNNTTSQGWEGMSMFADSHVRPGDERLKRIETYFRANLQDICDTGAAAGVPVIVCTIPVNLKDSAPFGSLHAPNLSEEQTAAWDREYQEGVRREGAKEYAEALRCYAAAGGIDDTFADLAFRRARCYRALGKTAEAREQFIRARDLDALPFRTSTIINEAIRDVVASRSDVGARLADAERAFDRNSPDGIPGDDLFLEHVHMTFKGNYILACNLFRSITELAPTGLGLESNEKSGPLSEEQCAERLVYTPWHALKNRERLNSINWTQPFLCQLDHEEHGKRWRKTLDAMRPGSIPEAGRKR